MRKHRTVSQTLDFHSLMQRASRLFATNWLQGLDFMTVKLRAWLQKSKIRRHSSQQNSQSVKSESTPIQTSFNKQPSTHQALIQSTAKPNYLQKHRSNTRKGAPPHGTKANSDRHFGSLSCFQSPERSLTSYLSVTLITPKTARCSRSMLTLKLVMEANFKTNPTLQRAFLRKSRATQSATQLQQPKRSRFVRAPLNAFPLLALPYLNLNALTVASLNSYRLMTLQQIQMADRS